MHFSDKHPKHLFNFKALRCGNYSRLALKKEKRLVQTSESYSHEIPKKRSFQITANNYHTIYVLLYIPELITILIFPLFAYLLKMYFNSGNKHAF